MSEGCCGRGTKLLRQSEPFNRHVCAAAVGAVSFSGVAGRQAGRQAGSDQDGGRRQKHLEGDAVRFAPFPTEAPLMMRARYSPVLVSCSQPNEATIEVPRSLGHYWPNRYRRAAPCVCLAPYCSSADVPNGRIIFLCCPSRSPKRKKNA